MENVISLLEGEIVKFKLNVERNKKNNLKHIAQYYEELKVEYEAAIKVLKISTNVPVIGQLQQDDDDTLEDFWGEEEDKREVGL